MAVLSMSDEDYRREATKMVPYVMNNEDQNPTYVILQKIIADAVSARASIPPIPAV
jgi:hypothetical protein